MKFNYKYLIKLVFSAMAGVAFTAFVLYIAVKAPTIHNRYIRTYVGSHVYYIVPSANTGGGGTGFTIEAPSGTTYFLTNDHVCRLSKDGTMLVIDESGANAQQKIIYQSFTTDLCLLEAPQYLDGLKLGSHVYAGESVRAVGHPGLMPITLSNTGEVTHFRSVEYDDNDDKYCKEFSLKYKFKQEGGKSVCMLMVPMAYQTTVLARPGFSGSPLVNDAGEVLGVVVGVDEHSYAAAITLEEVKQILSDK